MDDILRRLTDFTVGLEFEHLSADAVHQCKRRIVDTLGCALGGHRSEPARIARAAASRITSTQPASVLASGIETSPEMAAFANGVMIRYLDLNDATGSGGGHPSDALGALLAAAQIGHCDGRRLIVANTIVYEIFLGFFAAVRIRNSGWDHVVYTVLAATAGVAKLLGLDRAATANALALALAPNMAMEVVRRGQLSMWKGCAGPNAARNAVFAALLAADGMTGPEAVFSGEHGVFEAVGEFDWPALPGPQGDYRICTTQMKLYPCEYHGQSPVAAAIRMRPQVDIAAVESIVVKTYWFAWSETGSEPAKWAPTTRETADHSIPYLVCVALMDGKVDADSFTQARMMDPVLRALMQKVEVVHDRSLDAMQPAANPCRIEVKLAGGRIVEGSVDYPKGHVRNPPTDDEIADKLRQLNAGLLPVARVEKAIDLCWKLDSLVDVSLLMDALQPDAG
jgi:2-methylcitrate dehydratase